jgi:hypothetical protein
MNRATELQPHELAALFPPMPEDELIELALDIKRNGQLEPIEILDGKILDGVSRYKACRKAGVEPKTILWENSDGLEAAYQHVVSRNIHRRHLTAGQKAFIGLDAWPALRERVGKGGGGDRKSNVSQEHLIPAAEEIAAKVGVPAHTIRAAQRVREQAPDLAKKVQLGEMSVGAADAQRAERKSSAVIQARREEKVRRDLEWQTRIVKAHLNALDRFDDLLAEMREALKAGKYSPEAKPFVVRRLDKTIERIKKIQEDFAR